MARNGPYFLLLAVVFAAGIALGTLVFGPRTVAGRPADARDRAASAPERTAATLSDASLAAPLAEALEPALVELRIAISTLAKAIEGGALSRGPSGEAATTTRASATSDAAQADGAALAQSIARLAEAIQTLERGARRHGGELASDLVAPTWIDRESAFANAGLRDAARVEGDLVEKAEASFQRRHLLWSTQDLLSSYGKPDSIEVNGDQADWSYEVRFRGGEENYHFYIHDETVIQISYDWDFHE